MLPLRGEQLGPANETIRSLSYPMPDVAVMRSLTKRIATSEAIAEATAERWLAEMLKFLDTAGSIRGTSDDRPLAPSAAVDAAWHAFILHTQAYTDFCARHFGGYIHHRVAPPDANGTDAEPLVDYLVTRVLVARRHGVLDEELWPVRWNAEPETPDTDEVG